jgi:hypothetical protein
VSDEVTDTSSRRVGTPCPREWFSKRLAEQRAACHTKLADACALENQVAMLRGEVAL